MVDGKDTVEPIRVLVVEDNPLIRDLINHGIRRLQEDLEGCPPIEVLEVDNGATAWDRIGSSKIDLVMEARPELSVVAVAEAERDAPAATRGQLVAALDRVLEAGVTEPLESPEAAHALESLLGSAEGLDAQTRADLVQGYDWGG